MFYPVILSGGLGTRLWPISSKNNPKQFKALLGQKTLLQTTYDRVLAGFAKEQIFVVTTTNLVHSVKEQIKIEQNNIIVEPQAKGTALAVGLAALNIFNLDKSALIVTINSDQYIKEEQKYLEFIKMAGEVVEKNPDKMVLIGIKPNYPETGYGYIEFGKMTEDKQVFEVKSFKEKPDFNTAKKYLASGNYLWNPAFFVFKAESLLSWYKEFLPATYKILQSISQDNSEANLAKSYALAENISIDYGLLEKMSNRLVIPADICWADIGSWRSLRDIQLKDSDANVSNTKNVLLDSKRNLFYSFSGKLIAAIGVEDLVLVETDEVILLCPAEKSQEVKNILEKIKGTDLEKYL
ncbi:MAG: sugar phosphate nucleotidyltransferase [bacterium]|nr:sugar phosphate nucleotidyltransferase [bacterium]